MNNPIIDISKTYESKLVEKRIYKFWSENGFFTPKIDVAKKPFTIIMPPPNVTGELHMGHALTAALEDLMVRWHRMKGTPTLWLPGTDHAGIATQVVVERMLKQENIDRHKLGRDKFLERAWEWVRKYGNIIDEQHKRLGVSADWTRKNFTLNDGPSNAVRNTFVNLFNKGLIYRGERIINWCPRCATALSDLEVDYQEQSTFLYYIQYKLLNQDDSIIVATTRPETLLGDTALAVNPDDQRYTHIIGKEVIIPIIERKIPVIGDNGVSLEFGTGALKVTPGHDPNDFEIGKRHNLPIINIMNLDGTINKNGCQYSGIDRFEVRKKIVEDLEAIGLLDKVDAYNHSVGQCQRCQTIVEPLVSKQWFIKMAPLAQPAIDVVKNKKIKIIPERFTKVYMNWMENIRDWCISRQLWWGHRIPVWYCTKCDGNNITLVLTPKTDLKEVHSLREFLTTMPLADIDRRIESATINMEVKPIVAIEKPLNCPQCGNTELFQDPDVLDTWFSSALWTHSTLGWPNKSEDLKYFYPTNVLETGYDILFFWVARMIMMGIENMKEIPFSTIYLHGLVRDPQGIKMSKTKGNVMDPLKIIDAYGTDALRFALTTGNTPGNDMRISENKLESSRNFANKLWNASRFVIIQIQKTPNVKIWESSISPSHLEDRWIISRLNQVILKVNNLIEGHQFGEAQREIYEFIWGEYCDWYIEMAKIRLKFSTTPNPIPILADTLDKILRLLHPFMPFITEEIWQLLHNSNRHQPPFLSIMIAPYPKDEDMIDESAENQISIITNIIKAVRALKAEFRIEPSRSIEAFIQATNIKTITSESKVIETLAKISTLHIEEATNPSRRDENVTIVVGSISISLPLGNLVDLNNEKKRLENDLNDCKKNLNGFNKRLNNSQFLKKAPPELISKERERRNILQERESKLNEILSQL